MNDTLKKIYGSSNKKLEKMDVDYEASYREFLVKLDKVAGFEPKNKYLYAVMDGVPFQDMNNALDIAIENRPNNKGG